MAPRLGSLLSVAVCTFVLTRLLDVYIAPAPSLSGPNVHSLEQRISERPATGHSSTEGAGRGLLGSAEAEVLDVSVARPTMAVPASATSNAAFPAATSVPTSTDFFIVIGLPIGIDKNNRDRRYLLRRMWMAEYPNIGKTVRVEFVIGLVTYQGDGHDEATLSGLYSEHSRFGDIAFVNAREATRDPYRGDPKCTGEKMVAWFCHVVAVHGNTPYFVKVGPRPDTWTHAMARGSTLCTWIHAAPRRGRRTGTRGSTLCDSRTICVGCYASLVISTASPTFA
jgi:hypothetical protein